MAHKLENKDLKGIFQNRGIIMNAGEGGPEDGVDQYNKYGIYHDVSDTKEFLCVIMERDDPAANPDGPWTEDDYIPYSVARLDLNSMQWKTESGNMKLISSPSFAFLDSEDEFIDELQKHLDKRVDAAATSSAPTERFDETEP